MSASQYGASLLSEVQEESLDNLLIDLRQWLIPPPQHLLGLGELDKLVAAITSSISHLTQPTTRSPNHLYDDDEFQHEIAKGRHESDLRARAVNTIKPSIIEVTSSCTKTGKTSLLYLLTAIAILPQEHDGNESTVVWLDTDSSFSATRLLKICLSQLLESSPAQSPAENHTIAKEALRHVHVFSIQSSKQLLRVLALLPAYLLQTDDPNDKDLVLPKHDSSHHRVSLVILDSAQAFQHLDRFDAEIARLEAIGTSRPAAPDALSITTQTITHLKSIQTQFECSILYTTTQLGQQPPHYTPTNQTPAGAAATTTTTSTSNPLTPNRPNISSMSYHTTSALSPWTTNATLSLSLFRIPVPQFEAHMSISECLRDRQDRQEVVKRGRVKVDLNEVWLSRVVRDRQLRTKLRSIENRGWVMRLAGGSVEVER